MPVLTIGRDPVRARFYFLRLGPEDSLWQQYVTFLGQVIRLDFGVSRVMAPSRVNELLGLLLPWSIGLLGIATLVAIGIGTLLGGLMAWPSVSRGLRLAGLPLVALAAIPAYVLGLVLVDLLAFRLRFFPIGGAAAVGVVSAPLPLHLLGMLHHAILPALAIILTAAGAWAVAARSLMVTVLGEDHLVLAEAKGLRPARILFGYGLRTVVPPQVTALGLALGQVVSGSLLVEIVFGYPGIGLLLYRAVTTFDYNTLHGVVLVIIVAVSLAGLVLDLLLPALDARLRAPRGRR